MLIVLLWNRINNFDNVIIIVLFQPRCLLRRNRGRRWRITRYVNAAGSCCHRSCHWSCRNLAAATTNATIAARSAATAAHGHSCRCDGGLVDALLHVALQHVASLELPAAEWTRVAGADPTLVALVTDQSSLKRKIYLSPMLTVVLKLTRKQLIVFINQTGRFNLLRNQNENQSALEVTLN